MIIKEIREKLVGPVFPIITPFKKAPNYEIDYDVMLRYIDFLYNEGVRLFYIMAYNGRFSLLSFDEIKLVNEKVRVNNNRGTLPSERSINRNNYNFFWLPFLCTYQLRNHL